MRLILTFVFLWTHYASAEPLKIPITYKIPFGSSIEDEMISAPLPNPGTISPLTPAFGESRHADVYLEGIRINDPSAPHATPNFNYINQDDPARIMHNRFELSPSNKALRGAFGNLGERVKLSLPHFNFSQNIYNFSNKTSLNSLNASLSHNFDLNQETKVESKILKIKGGSTYILSNSLFSSTTDQTGFLLKTISSDKLIVALSHFDIETDFGYTKIYGKTSELQTTYAFSPKIQFGLRAVHESNHDESRLISDLFFKNNTLEMGAKFLDQDIYPHATIQMKFSLNPDSWVGFEGLAQKYPPKLSELTTFYSDDGINRTTIRSKLSPETLIGLKGVLKYDIFKIDIGTDYLQNAIIYDYDQKKYINADAWGKPFIKIQTDFKVADIGYKYSSPSFISNQFEMINVPVHHWRAKLNFSNSKFLFHIYFDVMSDIKRYNSQKQKLENNGYEKRFGIKTGYFTQTTLTPFIEYSIIKADDAMPYAQDHIFWIGIEIIKN